MADKLGISESQLSQYIGKNPSKRIGQEVARRVERELKLPDGWMDKEFPDLSNVVLRIARDMQALDADALRLVSEFVKRLKK